MPEDKQAERRKDQLVGAEKPAEPPKYNWDDPAIPAGDAPPLPRWPLILAAAAWGAWLVFLVVMMIMRLGTTAV